MKLQFKLLGFLSNFNIGLSAPFLSLILCEHGCSLKNIGLAISIFSITVVIAEVPSGIFADLYGRKYSFLLSQVSGFFSAVLILISTSFFLTTLGLVFWGISMAFSSGSLDALAVEDVIKQHGERSLSKAVSTFQICGCTGVALGALAGSFIPYANGYANHLIIKLITGLITFLIAFSIPNENIPSQKNRSLRSHIDEIGTLFSGYKILKQLAFCIMAVALVQASIETYWQPQLAILQKSKLHNTLGLLSACAYLATILGCTLTGKIKIIQKAQKSIAYFCASICLLSLTIMIALVNNTVLFSCVYILIYLFIGIVSVTEQTIINQETTDNVRASVLSTTSFLSRMGGLISGFLSSILLQFCTIHTVWIIFSCICLFVITSLRPHKSA